MRRVTLSLLGFATCITLLSIASCKRETGALHEPPPAPTPARAKPAGRTAPAMPQPRAETPARAVQPATIPPTARNFAWPARRRAPRHTRHFARGSFSPHSVVLDATHVYWAAGDGTIWRKAKRGGARQLLVRGIHAISLRARGSWLYFSARQGIYRLKRAGGQPQLIVPVRDAVSLELHDQRVYFTRSKGRALYSAPLDPRRGGRPRLLLRARHVAGIAFGTERGKARLYLSDYYAGLVFSARLDGRGRRTITRAVRRPVDIAVVGRYVYICAERAGTVVRVRKRGGRPEVLARNLVNHEIMRVYDGGLFWRDWKGGRSHSSLWRLDLKTMKTAAVASDLSAPAGFAVDAEHVYLANKGSDEILRLPR